MAGLGKINWPRSVPDSVNTHGLTSLGPPFEDENALRLRVGDEPYAKSSPFLSLRGGNNALLQHSPPQTQSLPVEFSQGGVSPSSTSAPVTSTEEVRGETNGSANLDEWNPMMDDFTSPTFNVYSKGPGADLPKPQAEDLNPAEGSFGYLKQSREYRAKYMTSKGVSPPSGSTHNKIEGVTLYVANIPREVSKDGLRKLFSRVGNVQKIFIGQDSKWHGNTTFGFVQYGTIKEAERAILEFNGFEIGASTKLIVKIKQSEQDKKRKSQDRDETTFYNQLGAGVTSPGSRNMEALGDDQSTNQKVPWMSFDAPAAPSSSVSQTNSQPHNIVQQGSTLPLQSPTATVGSADKEYTPTQPSARSPFSSLANQFASNKSLGSPSSPNMENPVPNSTSPKMPDLQKVRVCIFCGKPSTKKCSVCKTPYCSIECQTKDWGQHSKVCRSLSAKDNQQPAASDSNQPIRVSTNGSTEFDDDFDISLSHLNLESSSLSHPEGVDPQPNETLPRPEGVAPQPNKTLPRPEGVAPQPNETLPRPEGVTPQPNEILPRPEGWAPQSNKTLPRPEGVAPQPNTIPVPSAPSSLPADGLTDELHSLSIGRGDSEDSLPSIQNLPLTYYVEYRSSKTFPIFTFFFGVVQCKEMITLPVELDNLKAAGNLRTVKRCEIIPKRTLLTLRNSKLVRVEVRSPVKGDTVSVQLADEGGYMECGVDNLLCIPPKLASIPHLCQKFVLHNVLILEYTDPMEAKVFLESIIKDKVIKITQKGSNSFGHMVEVFLKDGTKVNDLVSNSRFAVAGIPVASKESTLHKPTDNPHVPLTSMLDFHKPPLCGEIFELFPTLVYNPTHLWAQVRHLHLENLAHLIRDMTAYYSLMSSYGYRPHIGEAVAALWEKDNCWYRGDTISHNQDGSVFIRFFDFGNKENVQQHNIRKLENKAFLTLPRQAIHFQLAYVQPVDSIGKHEKNINWPKEVIEAIINKIQNKVVKAKVIHFTKPFNFFIEAWLPGNENTTSINEWLVQCGMASKCGLPDNLRPLPLGNEALKGIGRASTVLKLVHGITPGQRGPQAPAEWFPLSSRGCSPILPTPSFVQGTPPSLGSKDSPLEQRSFISNSNHGTQIHQLSLDSPSSQIVQSVGALNGEGYSSHKETSENWTHSSNNPKLSGASPKKQGLASWTPNDYSEGNTIKNLSPDIRSEKSKIPWTSNPGQQTSNPGHRSSNPGQQTSNPGHRSSNPGQQTSNPGHRSSNPGQQTSNPGHRSSNPGQQTSNPGHRSSNPGQQTSNPGHRSSNPGQQTSNPGHRSSNPGQQTSNPGHRSSNPGQQTSNPGHRSSNPGRQTSGTVPAQRSPKPLEVTVKKEPIFDDSCESSQLGSVSGNSSQVPTTSEGTVYYQSQPALQQLTATSSEPPSAPLPLKGQQVPVLVTHVHTTEDFSVQVLDEASLKQLNDMSVGALKQFAVTKTPSLGSHCMANYLGDYYRAKVMKVISASEVIVNFIDFGNTERVSLGLLKQIDPGYLSLPALALHCKLSDIQALRQGGLEYFKNLVLDQQVVADVKEVLLNQTVSVSLTLPNGMVVRELLDKQGFLSSPGTAATSVQPLLSETPKNQLNPSSKVIIVEVQSPSSFWVQYGTQETLDTLVKLNEDIQSFVGSGSAQLLPQSVPPGIVCLALFPDDSKWYRAAFVRYSSEGSIVRFIDYGNSVAVTPENLRAIPQSLLATPPQAFHCAMADIEPSSQQWTQGAIQFLSGFMDTLLTVVMCKHRQDIYHIDLLHQSDSMKQSLISKGWAKLMSASASVKAATLPSGPFSALVMHVESPDSIWFQLDNGDNQKKLMNLYENLSAYCKNCAQESVLWKEGEFCAVLNSEDEIWYRGQILKTSSNNVQVRFIDFGMSHSSTVQHLRPLTAPLADFPSQAIQGKLAEVVSVTESDMWPKPAIAFLNQMILEKQVTVSVTSRNGPVYVVKIKLKDQQVDEALIKAGHALYLPQVDQSIPSSFTRPKEVSPFQPLVPTQAMKPAKQKASPEIQDAKHKPVRILLSECKWVQLPSSERFNVLVSHVLSVGKFWIQVAEREHISGLMQLMEAISNHTKSPQVSPYQKPPVKDELCLALFSEDQNWYRASVIDVSGSVVTVQFVDFGNMDTVSPASLLKIPSSLLSLPIQAVECALIGVPQAEHSSPSLSVTNAFKRATDGRCLACEVYSRDPLCVSLLDPSTSGTSVRDSLVRAQLLPVIEDKAMVKVEQTRLPMSDMTTVLISHANSPGDFYVQIITQSSISNFEHLTRKMNEYCNGRPSGSPSIHYGQLLCAKFSEDQMWYRARVISFVDKSTALVQFIDFGNTDIVSLNDVIPIHPDLTHLPGQAAHCCLVGYEGGEVVDKGLTSRFSSQTSNKPLNALCKGLSFRAGGSIRSVVELVDTTTSNDVKISSSLASH